MRDDHDAEDPTTRNLRTLDDIPLAILPEGMARSILTALASAGHDCYAYANPSSPPTWYVWIDPLARISSTRDGRVPVETWTHTWQWIAPAIHCAIEHPRQLITERLTGLQALDDLTDDLTEGTR